MVIPIFLTARAISHSVRPKFLVERRDLARERLAREGQPIPQDIAPA